MVLPELRRLGPGGLLRRLRSLEGRCLIPLEDPSSAALLPILEGLAAATRARTIEIVQRDLSTERGSRLRGLTGIAGLAVASVDARRALHSTQRDLDQLLRVPRRPARLDGDRVLFVNANLWFG
ncbi:MAG: hypothetical protein ACXVRJ_09410, partial [Gaiellaceae bacterium]